MLGIDAFLAMRLKTEVDKRNAQQQATYPRQLWKTGGWQFSPQYLLNERSNPMTLCPVALVAGCQKCPIVALCPLKGIIGDYQKPEAAPPPPTEPPAKGKK